MHVARFFFFFFLSEIIRAIRRKRDCSRRWDFTCSARSAAATTRNPLYRSREFPLGGRVIYFERWAARARARARTSLNYLNLSVIFGQPTRRARLKSALTPLTKFSTSDSIIENLHVGARAISRDRKVLSRSLPYHPHAWGRERERRGGGFQCAAAA